MEGLTICLGCKYLNKGANPNKKFDLDVDPPPCMSFPNGIPNEIWFGGYDHRTQFADEPLLFALDMDEDTLPLSAAYLATYNATIRILKDKGFPVGGSTV